jgi:hypothetical protein
MQFQFDMQLAQLKEQVINKNAQEAEDRKDNRTKIQATQQSALIDQRKNNTMPQDFETPDQDIMSDFNKMLGE